MRVITGIARGTRLKSFEGDNVRPTTDKVKEAIFSSIHFVVEGSKVLDLFAGTGQLGIEALSRGAEKCVFRVGHPLHLRGDRRAGLLQLHDFHFLLL